MGVALKPVVAVEVQIPVMAEALRTTAPVIDCRQVSYFTHASTSTVAL